MDQLFSKLPKTAAEAKEIGSKYYFTGKQCKNGHISKRLVSDNNCCECKLERVKSYRESNKEAIKDYVKSHRDANREAIRAREKNYRDANKEVIRVRKKNYKLRKRAERLGCSVEELPKRSTPDPARYVYFLVVKDSATNEKLFLKAGISNNPTNRLKTHKHELAKHGLIFDTILVKDFETEEAARAIEDKIKSSYIVYESGITGFTDECFLYLPQFEQSMLTLLSK